MYYNSPLAYVAGAERGGKRGEIIRKRRVRDEEGRERGKMKRETLLSAFNNNFSHF